MNKPVKQARAFQMPAEDLDDMRLAVNALKQVEAAPEPYDASPGMPARPAYRKDKKNLSVWLDEKAFRQFKSLVAEEGETLQDYVIKMLNREFAAKGRPQIAK